MGSSLEHSIRVYLGGVADVGMLQQVLDAEDDLA